MGSFVIDGSKEYYLNHEPPNPQEKDIWAYEESNYIQVQTWINGLWYPVVDVKPTEDGKVKITYTSDDEATEDIDLLDYQYRIGVL